MRHNNNYIDTTAINSTAGHCLIQSNNTSTYSSKVRLHCLLPWILLTLRRHCVHFHLGFLLTTRAVNVASHCSPSLGFGFTLFQLQLSLSSCWTVTWHGALRSDKSWYMLPWDLDVNVVTGILHSLRSFCLLYNRWKWFCFCDKRAYYNIVLVQAAESLV